MTVKQEYLGALADAQEAFNERVAEVTTALLATPPPVQLTAAGKPAATQLYDLLVTKTKVATVKKFGYGGGYEECLAVTGVDENGNKFWTRLGGADGLYGEVRPGDVVRLAARVRGHGDNPDFPITFLGTARLLQTVEPEAFA